MPSLPSKDKITRQTHVRARLPTRSSNAILASILSLRSSGPRWRPRPAQAGQKTIPHERQMSTLPLYLFQPSTSTQRPITNFQRKRVPHKNQVSLPPLSTVNVDATPGSQIFSENTSMRPPRKDRCPTSFNRQRRRNARLQIFNDLRCLV